MSECNIRLQGTIEKYKKSPTSLVYDYRVSSSAVRLYSVMLDFEYKKAFVSVELLAKKMLNKKGEPASTSKIKRLISELKQAGWLCVDEQRVYHKDSEKMSYNMTFAAGVAEFGLVLRNSEYTIRTQAQ